MNIKYLILSSLLLLTSFSSVNARMIENAKRTRDMFKTAAGCTQTTATIDLDINNVRARLMNGGDMWWDRGAGTPAYEVPKVTTAGQQSKCALFAGSIWIGGIDQNSGQLKVAAQTYRQNGNDYWSGPLNDSATIDASTCAVWDRFWKINLSDINTFRSIYAGMVDPLEIENAILNANVPDVIKEWPAKGNADAKGVGGVNLNIANNKPLADFVDFNNDGIYNWKKGDYPRIFGDQYIWWVFNDKGNSKTETGSLGIGLEIQAAAFAFSTGDYLNDATFNSYKVINKATADLDSTFMSTWSDADLGNYLDDFVGCDIERGLGILYNGDELDEGNTGYGKNIPQIGIDYFRGPKPNDTAAPLPMTAFMYFNNDGSVTGNPSTLNHFYNYMTGTWQDNTKWVNSATGTGAGTPTKFLNPLKWECENNNTPADRRFVHSSGPFTLKPGQVNDIVIGAIWVPDAGACTGFTKLQLADDKAQALFIDNFKLRFGPQAPDLVAKPYDEKIVFYLNNPTSSNNYRENYGNTDSIGVSENKYLETASKPTFVGNPDSFYKFEGYVVYQLKNANVNISSIRNADGSINSANARIAFQCDKKNGITKLYNYENDPESGFYLPRLMVYGEDKGIKNNFVITEDLFSNTSDRALVNYKTYYYVAISYGQNTFAKFNPSNAQSTQDREYIESRTDGRSNPLQIIKVIPTPAYDNIYSQNQVTYNDGISLKRVEGNGNGGYMLELTDKTVEDEILSQTNGFVSKMPKYKAGNTPVSVRVTAPDSIKSGDYEIFVKVDSAYSTTNKDSTLGAFPSKTHWFITRKITGSSITDTIYSEKDITGYNEQLLIKWGSEAKPIEDWGFAVDMKQTQRAGDSSTSISNAFLGAEMTFAEPGKAWLTGLPDQNGNSLLNWIRAGVNSIDPPTTFGCNMNDYGVSALAGYDNAATYGGILGGTWAPYNLVNGFNNARCLSAYFYNRLGTNDPTFLVRRNNPLMNVHSVDIVLTKDKSKWTRCAVVEMNEGSDAMAPINSQGDAAKYNLRQHPSWDMEWNADGTPKYNTTGDYGHSWFPGYAINVETGERLNMMFGEDSWLKDDNGDDMIWNPSEVYFDPVNSNVRFGGRHAVYVSRTRYDAYPGGADFIWNKLSQIPKSTYNPTALTSAKDDVYNTMMWVTVPIKNRDYDYLSFEEGFIPTDVKIKIRVARPYVKLQGDNSVALRNNAWPLYSFNTSDIAPVTLSNGSNTYSGDTRALLDNIRAVPNPYYGFSAYENSRLDSRIKITNLPQIATIKIYQTDGSLVRTLLKNDIGTTYIDWDLKNDKGVPISSGMYLMHVKIKTEQGDKETIIKWFGVMRPLDITQFK